MLKIVLVLLVIIVSVFVVRIFLENKFCNSCNMEELSCDDSVAEESFPLGHPINTNAVNCACCKCLKEFDMEACGDCTLDNEWATCHDGYYFLTS